MQIPFLIRLAFVELLGEASVYIAMRYAHMTAKRLPPPPPPVARCCESKNNRLHTRLPYNIPTTHVSHSQTVYR